MRSLTRIGVATTVAGLLGAGAFTAATVMAGTAHADTASFCVGLGAPVSCQINDVVINSPSTITLVANVTPAGGINVGFNWKAVCTKGGSVQTTTGGQTTMNRNDPLTLGFTNPDQCTVQVRSWLPGTRSVSPSSTASPSPSPTSTATVASLTLDVNFTTQTAPGASPTPSPTTAHPVYHVARGMSGECIDVARNSSSKRAKVEIWKCSSSDAAQALTYSHSNLKHNGMCLNAKGNAKAGSKIILWNCTSSANEAWTHKSNGEFVLKANGGKLCLTDPGSSTKNGTQLVVAACANSRNQHWSVP
jgi:hypothetical protein